MGGDSVLISSGVSKEGLLNGVHDVVHALVGLVGVGLSMLGAGGNAVCDVGMGEITPLRRVCFVIEPGGLGGELRYAALVISVGGLFFLPGLRFVWDPGGVYLCLHH